MDGTTELAWTLVLVTGIVLCSALAPGCASSGGEPPSEGLTDEWISAEVRGRLSEEEDLAGTTIRVQTRDRVVILSGIVETLDQVREALRLAGRVEGVEQVVNRLRVIPGADGDSGDAPS